MPKILHLPLNVPGSEQVGQEKGFRDVFISDGGAYQQLDYLNYAGINGNEAANNALLNQIRDFRPDIIWAQLQETNVLTKETWQKIRQEFPELWLTTWSGDSRDYVPPYLASILPYFDIFYNATDQKIYEGLAKDLKFMPIAIDPDEGSNFTFPTPVIPKIVFIGNHYGTQFPNGQERYDLMVALTKEFGNDFGVYGSGWPHGEINLLGPVELKHQGTYYHKAKVVISIDHFKTFNFWSERRIWALMSATPTMVQWHPGIEKNFIDHKCCIFFVNKDDCILSIKELLANPNMAEHIGERGREVALKNHTWHSRARKVKEDYERHRQ